MATVDICNYKCVRAVRHSLYNTILFWNHSCYMLDQNEVELSVVLLQGMVCWIMNMVFQQSNIHSAEVV